MSAFARIHSGPGHFVATWIGVTMLAGSAAQPVKETVIYKKADDCEIKADVFHNGVARPRPAVVWIHGGGVINGHREQVSAQVRDFALTNGYVLVSLDYRLALETKLPEILDDIEDAFRWLRDEGARRFGVDPDRIAVAGGSAGGFLTLCSGFRVQPPPRVLLSLWGYGEILSDWASKPSPHPRHHATKVSDDDYRAQLGGPVVSDSRDRKADGGKIYLHGRQTGRWAQAISGFDPQREAEKFSSLLPIENVSSGYPPTVMIHGIADTDVPVEQSRLMAREFAKRGVPFELHEIANAEHGLGGGDPEQIKEAYRKAFQFVKERLEQP